MFDHKGMDDTQHFNHTILKLNEYAYDWYDSFQVQRVRDGKEKIKT